MHVPWEFRLRFSRNLKRTTPWDFHGAFMGLSWCVLRTPMVRPWDSHRASMGFPWSFHGSCMGLSWWFHDMSKLSRVLLDIRGIFMMLSWDTQASMRPPWECRGNPTALQWTSVIFFIGPPWCYYGTYMGLPLCFRRPFAGRFYGTSEFRWDCCMRLIRDASMEITCNSGIPKNFPMGL